MRMSEAEWLTCTDPELMLRVVRRRASDRLLRLFAAGCCRLLWDRLPFEDCREAVRLGERYADDLASREDLETALRALNRRAAGERGWRARLAQVSAFLLRPHFRTSAEQVARLARTGCEQHLLPARQSDLLRDLFGNPFRSVSFDSPWRTPAVLALAEAVYENRDSATGLLDPGHLAVLADALEEAGCENADLLQHLRGPGQHTRGCWLVDRILDKQ